MITSNFKSLLALILHASQTDNTGVAAVKDVNGSTYYATPNFTFPASTALNFTLDQAAAGVSLGSSSTAASASDYKLQSPITSGLTGTIVSTETATSDGPLYTIQLTVTNTSASSITIGEIGYKQHLSVSSSSGSTGTRDAVCLLDRTVLSTPVTLSGGESAVIRYKLKSLLAGSGGGGDDPTPSGTPKLEVTSLPTRTTYNESTGYELNLTGLVVTYTDKNGNTSDVTSSCEITPSAGTVLEKPSGSSTSRTQTIGIRYADQIGYSGYTSFAVTVTKESEPSFDPILSLVTKPNILVYNETTGYNLDLTGLKVTYQTKADVIRDVTSLCTITPPAGTALQQPSAGGTMTHTVTATYEGKSVSWTVTTTKKSSSGTYTGDIVPFSTGAEDKVIAMIDAARAGTLDLHSEGGWNVGDTREILMNNTARKITIASFAKYNGANNVLQLDFTDVSLLLYHVEDSGDDGTYGNSWLHKTWLNSTDEYDSPLVEVPEWVRTRLVPFSIKCYEPGTTRTLKTYSNCKFALRSYDEIFGGNKFNGISEGVQAELYTNTVFRKRYIYSTSGNSTYVWWTRTQDGLHSYYGVTRNGEQSSSGENGANTDMVITPFFLL